jgi:hypothetical protein
MKMMKMKRTNMKTNVINRTMIKRYRESDEYLNICTSESIITTGLVNGKM